MFSHLLLANAFYVECNLVHAFWELRLRRLVVKAADAAVGLAELAPGRFHVMEELLQSVQSKALMATAQMALGRSSRS